MRPALLGAVGHQQVSASFAPEEVAGAVACWVADDVALADGAAVSSWVDRIGSFDAAQATGTKQPLYRTSGIGGAPAVDFDGSDDILTVSNVLSTAASGHVFVVVDADATATNFSHVVWSRTDIHDNFHYLHGYSSFVYVTNGKGGISSRAGGAQNVVEWNTAYDDGVAHLMEWSSDGSAWAFMVDGTSLGKTTRAGSDTGDWFDIANADAFLIGAQRIGGSEGNTFNGRIAMVLVVAGAIASGDRTSLHDWVETKYGITVA